ncbi:MAG: thiamine biosynthesis protein ApbE [Clostridiales bacterium GWF2_38_85]|nr:MAG: thiamine biosynthesis protein ApbE [Clostridiales bacterium GWF2_38_85]HBL84619.1 FAD:protein FMN transferase [Clostridiales bacterium]
MKKILLFILCIILLLPAGCAGNSPKRYQAEFLTLFDTVTRIVGYSDSKEEFTELSQSIYDELEIYHQLYDIYNDYDGVNNIKTINDNAGKSPTIVDSRIIDLLLFAKTQYIKTNGKVNVAFGAVLKIWHDYREQGIDDPENAALPQMTELEAAAEHCNIDDVVIDEDASTVYLSDPMMRLDVGAVAKGYATEQVAKHFEAKGVTSLLISVGGNVRAIGSKADGGNGNTNPWVIGIQNPDKINENTELFSVEISELSVVTSGSYERYYTVDGKQYHHIIDPETLMPAEYCTAVSVICRDSGLADAFSTATFNMPVDKAKAFINSIDGVEAMWVLPDRSIEYSANFENYKQN